MTREEREALVKQVFQRITIDGIDFVDIEAKPEYTPLFATIATGQKVGYQEMDSSPSPDTLLLLPSGISVSGIESWAGRLLRRTGLSMALAGSWTPPRKHSLPTPLPPGTP